MSVELFNHLHVGDIQKYTTDSLVENAVYFNEIANSIVEPVLLGLKNSGATMDALKEEAALLLENNAQLISGFARFNEEFPKIISLIDRLQGYGGLDTTRFGEMSEAPNGYDEKLVWDSLLVQYTLNNNLQLLEVLQGTLKILRIRKKFGDGAFTTIEEALAYWKSSFILLPSPLFPLPFRETVTPEGDDPEVPTVDPSYTLLAELYHARKVLTASYAAQNESLKLKKLSSSDFEETLLRGSNEDLFGRGRGDIQFDATALYDVYLNYKSPEFLSGERISGLDRFALQTLSNLGVNLNDVSIPTAIGLVDQAAGAVLKRIPYEPVKKHVTNIGSTVIEIDQIELQRIICQQDERVDHCRLIYNLNQENPATSLVQVLGMGYANIIRQELLRYDTGEIAHIENILKGESKNRSHRNLKRTETFSETISSTTHETETDERSSDRYELDKETSKMTSSSTDLGVGVSVTAGYGPVSVSAGLNYASSSASTEAVNQSVNISKEVTRRAVEKIRTSVQETRSVLSINEIEVITQHGINNIEGTDHVNGFYFWVDKVYEHQVVNKGKRLMLEFLVPEPAAFYIYAKSQSTTEGINVEKPIPPTKYVDSLLKAPLKSFEDITIDNYLFWGAVYDAQSLPLPPSDYETVCGTYVLDYVPESKAWNDIAINSLKVPSGYKADYGKMNIGFSSGSGRYIAGYLGNSRFSQSSVTLTPLVIPLDGERDIVPLSFRGHFDEYHMNVEIFCSLTPERQAQWKQDVYQAILGAYKQKLSEYEDALNELSFSRNVMLNGDNPLINRETERTELKKWGIELLTLQRFGQFDAMKNATNGHPEIHFQEAFEDGNFAKFFEQSIEWGNMTYVFYPYYWGRKPRWTVTSQYDDTDPMFKKFLQAGFARVVVPVHPKFTKAILHFLSSGEIWQGQDLPSIDNDLYLSIIEEIQLAEDNTLGTEIGDPWEVKVPTNLVMLTSQIPSNLPGS